MGERERKREKEREREREREREKRQTDRQHYPNQTSVPFPSNSGVNLTFMLL